MINDIIKYSKNKIEKFEENEKISEIKRKRGRPLHSDVRQNIIDILYLYKRLYGYQIYKIYMDLFPEITLRLVYYHVRKGTSTGEFSIKEIKKSSGNFSWGTTSENVLYELGPEAHPRINDQIKKHFETHKKRFFYNNQYDQ